MADQGTASARETPGAAEDRIQKYVDVALTEFDRGFSCAEAVFIAGAKGLGFESDLVPKLATGFGGGLSRTKGLCGALSGGVLVLGLKYGRTQPGDDRITVLSKVQTLVAHFRKEFGSDNCFALTKLDFNTDEGQAQYKTQGHGLCRTFVAYATRETLELCELQKTVDTPATGS